MSSVSTGLDRLLRPKSVVVVGGGEWGRLVLDNLRRDGFDGEIWVVHPTKAKVAGYRAVPAIKDLPGIPDAAYIAVNRRQTIQVVGELSTLGCGGAICFASGFSEAQAEDSSGAGLQTELVSAAGEMTIVGPNCYGLVNYLDGATLWPDQHGGARVETGVAIISQSSNMACNISMQKRGLPIAYLATAGNQAQTGLSDIGCAMLRDPRVTALGLHIEGIDDIRGFEKLSAVAHDLGKPIIALKIGKSEQARAATISHTASLAGSDAGASALLARLGIARMNALPAFLETLKLLHMCGPLSSDRLASMSCSGGEASLMADSAVELGVQFPGLSSVQKKALREALGPMVALSNPLDYHTYIWRDRAAIGKAFSAMMTGDLALGMVVLDFPRQDRCSPIDWYDVTAGMEQAIKQSGKPMAAVATLQECIPESEALKMIEAGIVPLMGVEEALLAAEAAAWLGRFIPGSEPVLTPGNPQNAAVLGEAEAKAVLSKFGLHIPKTQIARRSEVGKIADLVGYPCVLKGSGHAHKTEAGAVKVNLGTRQAVEEVAKSISGDSFLIEEMVSDGVVELLIGVVRDPAHGFVLTLGAGGQLTELFKDSTSLIIPSSEEQIDEALDKLRCAKLINGYRGQKAADRGAIIDAIMAVQAFVVDSADVLEEVEINPLIATPTSAVAVDALIRTA